jgi:arylsulfatase A-like enzyme
MMGRKNNSIKLLNFLFLLAIVPLSLSCTKQRPNVLLVFTDQQNVSMMSAAGNPYLKTPAMDRIASRGIMFSQSYCTSPVCGPARSSIVSGRMPHETGVEWNGDAMKEDIQNAGDIFRMAGYQTVWAGKWHLPVSYPQKTNSRQKEIKGFDMLPFYDPDISNWMLGAETDPPLTEAVVEFLDEYESEQPFFLAVSYHNPHDICFYPRKDGWVAAEDSMLLIRHYGFEYKLPDVIGTHPDNYDQLPPLPVNHEADTNEPEFILQKRLDHDEYGMETKLAFHEFGEKEWRGYYHAYCRLTEMVDQEIGKVLDALTENGFGNNTIILFTSDHGDGAASHQWAAKLSLYEESSKIPMIVSWPGEIPEGSVDDAHLVSQIDILPTLCDYAGISTSTEFTGMSLRTIIEDPEAAWRDFLVVELADYAPDRNRKGRMVRTANYKYNVFSSGSRNEQFYHLKSDPGEMKNGINDPANQEEIRKHKKLLREWLVETDDPFIF